MPTALHPLMHNAFGIRRRPRFRAVTIAVAGVLSACTEAPQEPQPPIDDCEIVDDGHTMVCSLSYPGCTFKAYLAALFVHCGHKSEYIVYRDWGNEACPDIYYYPEGTFHSPEDWEAFVGSCERREALE